ncbi:MAG: class I SAM-dependent methyltransferase [Chromatiales bacterium]
MRHLLEPFKNTILHPQWLSLRYHTAHRVALKELKACVVLDIGSGDSDHGRLLGAGCTVFRLDYPATNVRYRHHPDVYADACSLPIASESIDAILLLEVIEHIADDRKALAEIRRVLRPAGQLYCSAPFLYPEHDVPNDFRRYTAYGLRRLLSEHGLQIVSERRHGNSFVVALQLINLSLLEIARDVYTRKPMLGLVVGALVYPFCLLVNVVAWPLTRLRLGQASSFGSFVVAVKG